MAFTVPTSGAKAVLRGVRLVAGSTLPGARLVMGADQRFPETKSAKALKDLAKSLGVQNRIEFLGWIETQTAERRIAQANLGLGLLNTEMEQWRTALGASNKRFQIMKAGLPQIGDQNPGIPELIEGNRIGTCLKAHDPKEMADIVNAYVHDPMRCKAEGDRAFALHQQIYNYNSVFGRLMDRLENMP